MIIEELKKRIAPQTCPLCANIQDVIIHGHRPVVGEEGQVQFDKDKGYSFCNCRNIFFTDWKNINQGVYDPNYHKKYVNPTSKYLLSNYIVNYGQLIKDSLNHKTFGKAIEIGCVAPDVLDGLSRMGMKTYALDIVDHSFGKHQSIVENFEDYPLAKGAYSLIWASHIFEHFKDPIKAIKHCFDSLHPGGLLFVAMPDPYFIDWKVPHLWGHWHLDEHHIMWDMDSFAEALEEKGFEIIMKKHNVGYDHICIGDMHILARKKI